jgi:hypothetical protein
MELIAIWFSRENIGEVKTFHSENMLTLTALTERKKLPLERYSSGVHALFLTRKGFSTAISLFWNKFCLI